MSGLNNDDKIDKVENPYLSARQHYAGLIDASVATVRFWQFFGVFCLILAGLAGGGIFYMGSKSKYEPVFIPVDHLGHTFAALMVGDGAGADQPAVVQRYVEDWVINWRRITIDGTIQKDAIKHVWAMLRQKDPALRKIVDYYSDPVNAPKERVQVAKETVNPEIITALPQNPEKTTWLVDWKETTSDLEGHIRSVRAWRTNLTVHYMTAAEKEHREADDVRLNPLGIYITEFTYSRQS